VFSQNGYRKISKKLHVPHHVIFLEHIPHSHIPEATSQIEKSDIIYNDPC